MFFCLHACNPHPIGYNRGMKDTPAIVAIGYFFCGICLAAILGILIFGV